MQKGMDALPSFLEALERDLAAFLADPSQKRLALAPMPPQQRALVHQLADEGYGLATVSAGYVVMRQAKA